MTSQSNLVAAMALANSRSNRLAEFLRSGAILATVTILVGLMGIALFPALSKSAHVFFVFLIAHAVWFAHAWIRNDKMILSLNLAMVMTEIHAISTRLG